MIMVVCEILNLLHVLVTKRYISWRLRRGKLTSQQKCKQNLDTAQDGLEIIFKRLQCGENST